MNKESTHVRFMTLPEEKQKAIQELHKLCSVQVALLDSLAADMEHFESEYALDTAKYAIRKANELLEEYEYRLQELWGFQQNSKYHTWWLLCNRCRCPKDDNKDPIYYGNGKIINSECPIHGNLEDQVARRKFELWLQNNCQNLELTVDNGIEGSGTTELSGFFSNSRLKYEVPKGWYATELRHPDNDDSKPVTLEPKVYANFYGAFITKDPVVFPPIDGYYKVLDWNFIS